MQGYLSVVITYMHRLKMLSRHINTWCHFAVCSQHSFQALRPVSLYHSPYQLLCTLTVSIQSNENVLLVLICWEQGSPGRLQMGKKYKHVSPIIWRFVECQCNKRMSNKRNFINSLCFRNGHRVLWLYNKVAALYHPNHESNCLDSFAESQPLLCF